MMQTDGIQLICVKQQWKKTLIQMFIHHLKGCIHLMSNSLEKIREVIVLNVALKTLGRLILILKCTGCFFFFFGSFKNNIFVMLQETGRLMYQLCKCFNFSFLLKHIVI